MKIMEPDWRALTSLHADLILAAQTAERLGRGDGHYAEVERDKAAEARARAEAIAALLVRVEAPVLIPDPKQLSLLSDGGSR